MRLLLLARHGQSLFNVDSVVNGDPLLDRGLSPQGVAEAEKLRAQLTGTRIDLCVTSRFPRAQETALIALDGRSTAVAQLVDEDLDDIRVGDLEGQTLAAYRRWKRARARRDPFPGGESLDQAALRYARAYARLLDRPEEVVLCLCHEIPVRYAVNAAADSDDLDGPLHDVANATPYLFDADGLRRAVERIRALA